MEIKNCYYILISEKIMDLFYVVILETQRNMDLNLIFAIVTDINL
jgi:hypothetical protein